MSSYLWLKVSPIELNCSGELKIISENSLWSSTQRRLCFLRIAIVCYLRAGGRLGGCDKSWSAIVRFPTTPSTVHALQWKNSIDILQNDVHCTVTNDHSLINSKIELFTVKVVLNERILTYVLWTDTRFNKYILFFVGCQLRGLCVDLAGITFRPCNLLN